MCSDRYTKFILLKISYTPCADAAIYQNRLNGRGPTLLSVLQGGRWLPVQLSAKPYVQNGVSRKPRKKIIDKAEPKTNLYKEYKHK